MQPVAKYLYSAQSPSNSPMNCCVCIVLEFTHQSHCPKHLLCQLLSMLHQPCQGGHRHSPANKRHAPGGCPQSLTGQGIRCCNRHPPLAFLVNKRMTTQGHIQHCCKAARPSMENCSMYMAYCFKVQAPCCLPGVPCHLWDAASHVLADGSSGLLPAQCLQDDY